MGWLVGKTPALSSLPSPHPLPRAAAGRAALTVESAEERSRLKGWYLVW